MTDSLFRNLLFILFVSAAFAARASPIIESSHLSRLLEIHNRERAPPSVQVAAARGVLARILPSHLSSFDFEIISKEQCGGVFCFNISNHPSRGDKGAPEVRIRGVSGVELSAGLHWYLKNWCAAHISWEKTGGAQLYSVPKPSSLPRINSNGVLIRRPIPWNYYQNAVTSSYSFAWWDWERWEKEIDWMALQGINLPLAFNGQEAIWKKVFQGWLFSYDPFWKPPQMKGLLHSVPIGRLVVLDLYAEVKPVWITSEQFYGVPYIWCMLHNFAANIEMYGILDSIASGPVEARASENSTMVGVGMCMEGIEQNPVVYDLMSEMAYHHHKIDAKEWLNSYSRRRYGKFVPALQDAWGILYHTIYNCTDGANDKNRDVIVAFPDVEPSLIWKETSTSPKVQLVNRQNTLPHETSDSFDQPHLWYSTTDVIRALELFLAYGDEVSDSNTFRYDLIDLTRQALAKYGNQVFLMVIEAYQLNDVKKVTSYSRQFLDIVEDMDTLLACHNGYLLGPWLQSAKQLARDLEEEKQYEWNARTQITMWFDNTDTEASLLRDYGNKYWSGLLADYYKPRAAIYFKCMIESLVEGKSFPLEEWRREWISLTNKWQNSRKLFAVRPSGDALSISRKLFTKYLANSTATSFRTSSY